MRAAEDVVEFEQIPGADVARVLVPCGPAHHALEHWSLQGSAGRNRSDPIAGDCV